MKEVKDVLIISHVIHYSWKGVIYAYGPYAREIDIWAELFSQITIAAPLKFQLPPSDSLPFNNNNIRIHAQLERGGNNWIDKFWQTVSFPIMVLSLAVEIIRADATQVRCPGNLGMLGVLITPLLTRYRVAKYAGQWNGYLGEAWTYKLQRWLLGSRWWNAPVMVYGQWPDQANHIIPFFTSILETHQIEKAQICANQKRLHHPLRILFVGRLSLEKNVHILLSALQILGAEKENYSCRIVGDGIMRNHLEKQLIEIGIEPAVALVGSLPFDQVLAEYEWADILVLASETEGWPKAITEAMAFGVVCIGSLRGIVPQILGEGRGWLVEPGDSLMLANTLKYISTNENDYHNASQNAAKWSQNFSLDGFKSAVEKLLVKHWRISPISRMK